MSEEPRTENPKPNFYELYLMVGEIRADIKAIKDLQCEIKSNITQHDKRIVCLEKETSEIKGKSIIIGASIGIIIAIANLLLNVFRK
jgi:wobble nucleotide-excising tRNase